MPSCSTKSRVQRRGPRHLCFLLEDIFKEKSKVSLGKVMQQEDLLQHPAGAAVAPPHACAAASLIHFCNIY